MALMGGEMSNALATHSQGVTALGPPGANNVGQLQVAGHLSTALDAYGTGVLGGAVMVRHANTPQSHPNVTNEASDAPITIPRFLTAPEVHMIPSKAELVFIHVPKAVGDNGARLANAFTPTAVEEMVDMRSMIGLNIWALNHFLWVKQMELWRTNVERAALLTPKQIWHGCDEPGMEWTHWTLDGACRLEELLEQTGSVLNDGYASFTPFKITAKTPRTPEALKALTVTRAGRAQLKDIWQGRAGRAGAGMHLILTRVDYFQGEGQIRWTTTSKMETAQDAGPANNVTFTEKIPTLAEFTTLATSPNPKLSPRARTMYANMKKPPAPFQLVAYADESGGEVPSRFLVYDDPWEGLHYDALPLKVGQILHPAYGANPAPSIEEPKPDQGFAPVVNGFEAMTRMMITNVLLYPSKDGYMAQC